MTSRRTLSSENSIQIFWRPCFTVMYLKRDSRAQTHCLNFTEEGQLLSLHHKVLPVFRKTFHWHSYQCNGFLFSFFLSFFFFFFFFFFSASFSSPSFCFRGMACRSSISNPLFSLLPASSSISGANLRLPSNSNIPSAYFKAYPTVLLSSYVYFENNPNT